MRIGGENKPHVEQVICSGTPAPITESMVQLDFGTTDPQISLPGGDSTPEGKGWYLVTGFVRIDYDAATFAAPETVTVKIRNVNGGVDLVQVEFQTEIITTGTKTAALITFPPVLYEAQGDSILQILAQISNEPSAGALEAVEARITAIQLI